MKLNDYLDEAALRDHVRAGDVTERRSTRDSDLRIFNYSKTHAYANAWTDVTRKTRGLIWDAGKDQVLAVPFPKFFNAGERPEEEPPASERPVQVFDKRDGSLGIVYCTPLDGRWRVATRGSFSSEQAQVGTQLLANAAARANELRGPLGSGRLWDLDVDRTYLVEILAPSTRIVVDYHGYEGLDLLGVMDRLTGLEVSLTELSSAELEFWELAGRPAYGEPYREGLTTHHTRGFDAEGFVLLYADGTRLKVKHPDYVRLHRVMTGLSSRDVWRHAGISALRAGSAEAYRRASYAFGIPGNELDKYDVEQLRSEIPEEMYGWFDQTRAALEEAVTEGLREVSILEEDHGIAGLEGGDRAATIKRVAGGDKYLQGLLFSPKVTRSAMIWRALKPERETFKEDDS